MTLEELREQCLQCRRCPLCESRTNLVFGVGDERSKLMLVGEAPGRNEDLKGEPFVGRAGELLDTLLLAAGLPRESVYIANILKCRPPENRDPLPEEETACFGWLERQFEIISPKIVVCLGRIAAKQLISEDFMITRQHGEVFDKNGIKFMATFHPAALLRNPNYKPDAYADLKSARLLLEQL